MNIFKRKNEEVKPLLDSLLYRIEARGKYYHVWVKTPKSKNKRWHHINDFLTEILKLNPNDFEKLFVKSKMKNKPKITLFGKI